MHELIISSQVTNEVFQGLYQCGTDTTYTAEVEKRLRREGFSDLAEYVFHLANKFSFTLASLGYRLGASLYADAITAQLKKDGRQVNLNIFDILPELDGLPSSKADTKMNVDYYLLKFRQSSAVFIARSNKFRNSIREPEAKLGFNQGANEVVIPFIVKIHDPLPKQSPLTSPFKP